jgi:hypothetical protein
MPRFLSTSVDVVSWGVDSRLYVGWKRQLISHSSSLVSACKCTRTWSDAGHLNTGVPGLDPACTQATLLLSCGGTELRCRKRKYILPLLMFLRFICKILENEVPVSREYPLILLRIVWTTPMRCGTSACWYRTYGNCSARNRNSHVSCTYCSNLHHAADNPKESKTFRCHHCCIPHC